MSAAEIALLVMPLAAVAVAAFLAWSVVLALRPARLVTQGRWQEAVFAAQRLERSWLRAFSSVRTGAVYTRALCLHLEGKLDDALALLETIRGARGLTQAASLLEAATLVMAGRDIARAARILTPLCTAESPAEDTLFLAVAKHQLGDRKEADLLFSRAGATRAKSAPWPKINEPVFHYLRGLYLLKAKGGSEAARDLEAAASSPVVTMYVERARALVPPTSSSELEPRSSLDPQVIDE